MSARALPALPSLSPRSAAAAGAAVLALIVTAVTGLFTVGGRPTGATAATGAAVAGYPATSRGKQLQLIDDVGFRAVVRDLHDPRRVYVIVAHDSKPSACNVIKPTPTVVAQTAASVTIQVSGYEYLPAPDANGNSTFSCFVGGSTGVPVRLADALGSRRVLSGTHLLHSATAPAVAVLDPIDLPEPRHLPAGYRAVSAHPIDAVHGDLIAERHFAKGAADLVIASGLAADVDPTTGSAGVRTTVDGHRARIVQGTEMRCVIWTLPAGSGRSVCSYAAKPLVASVLLEVARTLR
jgi:hypothetical protein